MFLSILFIYVFLFINSNPKISHGKFAENQEYPHIVSVYKLDSGLKRFHFCAGALLNSKTVLLAAHCFDHVSDPTTLYVQAGTNDVTKNENGVTSHVISKIMHPLWDPAKYDKDGNLVNDHDVALMFLESAIEENGENIRYIDIYSGYVNPGITVDITGWGYQVEYDRDYLLHKITVPVHKSEKCQGCNDEIMICAGDGKGRDSCQGDSGTSLLKVFTLEDKRWSCLGVLSFGPEGMLILIVLTIIEGCGRNGAIGVYTRISYYEKWIWEHTTRPPPASKDFKPLIGIRNRVNITCDGIKQENINVCNKNGYCLDHDRCDCFNGFSGENCESIGTGVNVVVGYLIPIIFGILFCVLFYICQIVPLSILICDKMRSKDKEYFKQLKNQDEDEDNDYFSENISINLEKTTPIGDFSTPLASPKRNDTPKNDSKPLTL